MNKIKIGLGIDGVIVPRIPVALRGDPIYEHLDDKELYSLMRKTESKDGILVNFNKYFYNEKPSKEFEEFIKSLSYYTNILFDIVFITRRPYNNIKNILNDLKKQKNVTFSFVAELLTINSRISYCIENDINVFVDDELDMTYLDKGIYFIKAYDRHFDEVSNLISYKNFFEFKYKKRGDIDNNYGLTNDFLKTAIKNYNDNSYPYDDPYSYKEMPIMTVQEFLSHEDCVSYCLYIASYVRGINCDPFQEVIIDRDIYGWTCTHYAEIIPSANIKKLERAVIKKDKRGKECINFLNRVKGADRELLLSAAKEKGYVHGK